MGTRRPVHAKEGQIVDVLERDVNVFHNLQVRDTQITYLEGVRGISNRSHPIHAQHKSSSMKRMHKVQDSSLDAS